MPHWIRSRSTASVSSLVQACGAKASIPGSKRPPPPAHDSNRISGKRAVSRRVQVVDAEDVAVEELALPIGRQGDADHGSVMFRFMSHLT